MKKYAKKYMIYIVGVLLILLVGYGVVDRMTLDTIEVNCDGKTFQLHELEVGSSEPFKSVMKQMSPIPYIELGSKLKIDFNKLKPSQFEVHDYILTEEGQIRFHAPKFEQLFLKYRKQQY